MKENKLIIGTEKERDLILTALVKSRITTALDVMEKEQEFIQQLESMKFEKKLPFSWDEYIDGLLPATSNQVKTDLAYVRHAGFLFEAMFKLKKLMNVYNGLDANFEEGRPNYVIVKQGEEIATFTETQVIHFLSFKSNNIRNVFILNFKPLIKQYFDSFS